jgi:hypothetical protein
VEEVLIVQFPEVISPAVTVTCGLVVPVQDKVPYLCCSILHAPTFSKNHTHKQILIEAIFFVACRKIRE